MRIPNFSRALPPPGMCEHKKIKYWSTQYGKGQRCLECNRELTESHLWHDPFPTEFDKQVEAHRCAILHTYLHARECVCVYVCVCVLCVSCLVRRCICVCLLVRWACACICVWVGDCKTCCGRADGTAECSRHARPMNCSRELRKSACGSRRKSGSCTRPTSFSTTASTRRASGRKT